MFYYFIKWRKVHGFFCTAINFARYCPGRFYAVSAVFVRKGFANIHQEELTINDKQKGQPTP